MSNVRDFGAAGDGKVDDTESILHALRDGDGTLSFPPGDYVVSKPIVVELGKQVGATGRFAVEGTGGAAKIRMVGPGPCFHLKGTHDKTAFPADFSPEIWARQRMPTASNIEIEGGHPLADGFLVDGVMQATFEGVLLRKLRNALTATRRARNLLVSHCHIYDNTGVGVLLDRVNLHQAIIVGSHISYCRIAGIKLTGSEIRNLQITGNDIEYNYDLANKDCADILIDASQEGASVREGTISSNTIQAKQSSGGANVRFLGPGAKLNHKVGLFTISDNLIGSQEINVHLIACRGVVVSGNVIYSGHRRNVSVEGSRNIVFGANCLDHNPDYQEKELCTGLTVTDTADVTIQGLLIHDCQTGAHTVTTPVRIERQGLVEVVRCNRVTLTGSEILDGLPVGLFVDSSSNVNVNGCTLLESRKTSVWASAVRWQGAGVGNAITGCRLGKGAKGELDLDPNSGVLTGSNRYDDGLR